MTTKSEQLGEADWQLLRRTIKPAWSRKLALRFGIHVNSLRRWMRRPASDDPSHGTGAHSPLRRLCVLIEEVSRRDLVAAGEIAEYPRRYYRSLVETSVEGFGGDRLELDLATTRVLDECVDVIKSASLHGVNAATLREAIQARDCLDVLILRCEAEMGARRKAA